MKKLIALSFLALFACSQPSKNVNYMASEAQDQDAKVNASLARISSVSNSTNDLFDEVSTKAKAGL